MYEEIRAKIAELKNKNEVTDEEAPQYEFDVACGYDMALDDILSFLDTLEEDRPEPYNPVYDEAYLNEKIAKASKSWEGVDVDAMLDEGRGIEKSEKPTFLEEKEQVDLSPILQGYIPKIMWKFGMPEIERGAITETAYYFYELGRGHSEIPNDLEEAAKKEYPWDKSWMTPDMLDLNAHKQVAFCKGAKWKAEKDARDMYMSDNRHFEKVYQLGRADMKEQMMQEAVEGEVIVPIYEGNDIWSTEIKIPGRYEVGDKVRIIVIPNTDEK